MVIWLASYPRSGNTFFRMLLYHLYGVRTYSVYNDALLTDMGAAEVVGHERLPDSVEALDARPEPWFIKTHELPADRRPAIYLVRDGREVMCSFARYNRTFGPDQPEAARDQRPLDPATFRDSLRKLITISRQFGGWNTHVLRWLDRAQDAPTAIVRYEALVADPIATVRRALDEVGIRLTPAGGGEVPDFSTLHERWPEFFRKGRTGTWREEMDAELHELFWRHHAAAMDALGYGRDDSPHAAGAPGTDSGSEAGAPHPTTIDAR